MEKQELFESVSLFKSNFEGDVLAAFVRSTEYGEERFNSWKARFLKFCSANLPGASDELVKRFHVTGMIIARGESPKALFLRTRGNKIMAFLESLQIDIEKDECIFLVEDVVNLDKVATVINKSQILNKKIFIVHGHDPSLMHEVARFVTNIGLTPVILSEQVDQGKTIIEKIEAHTNVAYAIILYTADDQGHAKNCPNDIKFRARQNVLLEHGYLMAKLSRERVAYIVEAGIEMPSDIYGTMYQSRNNWKLKLAQEIAASTGLDVNFANIL